MHRFALVEKEINKGILVDEKSNVCIANWSPNNVRRLMFGAQYALVQYYVTGGKYDKHIEIVDLRQYLDKDLELVRTNPKKYVGLLSVLTSGRICSSVEEIIVCTEGYPPELLSVDLNFATLVTGKTGNVIDRLKNRFVRLNHISTVACSVQELARVLNTTKVSIELLLPLVKESFGTKTVYAGVEDWWAGTYLRSNIYKMDEEDRPLYNYFNTVKCTVLEAQRKAKLKMLDAKRTATILEKEGARLLFLCGEIRGLSHRAEVVSQKGGVVDNLQWCGHLSTTGTADILATYLFSNELGVLNNLTEDFESIDTQKLLITLKQITKNSHDVSFLIAYLSAITKIKHQETDKELDLEGALGKLVYIASKVLYMQHNIACFVLVLFLLRSRENYIDYHATKIDKNVLSQVLYTRKTMEFLNSVVTSGLAKKCLNTIGAAEVLVEEFPVELCAENTGNILNWMDYFMFCQGGLRHDLNS